MLGRPPRDGELRDVLALVDRGGEEAWTDLAHALFTLNEFLHID